MEAARQWGIVLASVIPKKISGEGRKKNIGDTKRVVGEILPAKSKRRWDDPTTWGSLKRRKKRL